MVTFSFNSCKKKTELKINFFKHFSCFTKSYVNSLLLILPIPSFKDECWRDKNHLVTTYFCITIFTSPGWGTSAVVWVVRSCQRIVVTTKQGSTGCERCIICITINFGLEHVNIIWKVKNVTVLISTTLELKWTEPVNINKSFKIKSN